MLLGVAIIAGVLAVFSGCGDSSEGSGGGTPSTTSTSGSGSGSSSESSSGGPPVQTSSLSKPEYVKKASAACERVRASLLGEANAFIAKEAAAKTPEPLILGNLGREVLGPNIEAEVAAVRELGAPEGDEAEIESILAAQEAALEKMKTVKKAVAMEELEDYFLPATKMYQAYGFTACTNSP
jgi:hypothetical protein